MNTGTGGRSFAGVLLGAAALLTSGCGTDWEDQPIGNVSVSGDGLTLAVGWHCHDDVEVEVEESGEEVRLHLRVSGYRGDCAELERITLSAPLGDRRVVDSTNGRGIPPCAGTEESAAVAECP